ncbi:MAG: hypothetical protein Kow001_00030 [Acidobacteriota bacterium]
MEPGPDSVIIRPRLPAGRAGTALSVKHYRRIGSSGASELRLLFDVRLDYLDVRSGARGRASLTLAAPPLVDPELEWTEDLVETAPEAELVEIVPPGPASWPGGSEDQMRRFLLRCFRLGIWRNSALGVYSVPGETREDFLRRCIELLSDEQDKALQDIRQVYLRRILELEQRALDSLEHPLWEGEQVDRRAVDIRDAFSEIREIFSRYLQTPPGADLAVPDVSGWGEKLDVECRERMEKLWMDLLPILNRIRGRLLWRAGQIEPYTMSLNHSSIDIQPRGFLWPPALG